MSGALVELPEDATCPGNADGEECDCLLAGKRPNSEMSKTHISQRTRSEDAPDCKELSFPHSQPVSFCVTLLYRNKKTVISALTVYNIHLPSSVSASGTDVMFSVMGLKSCWTHVIHKQQYLGIPITRFGD